MEQRVHHNRSPRVGEQLAAQSDESAAGNIELDAHASVAVIVHVGDFALARPQLLHHDADEFFRNVDCQVLHGFHELAVDALGDNLRLAHHQFETLAAHHFDEDRKLQFAAAQHLEGIRAA